MPLLLRPLSLADLDGAFALSSTAGWNQRIDDWRMLLELAPSGGFAAVLDDEIVATAIGIDYGSFGWIAMMLVQPALRGQGIGRRLLEAAMAAIPAGLPIRLDATPMGRPLYESCGFREEAALTRYLSDPVTRRIPDLPGGGAPGTVRAMTREQLERILGEDTAVFRGGRGPVLTWALDTGAPFCQVVEEDAGIGGYCFGRTGRLCAQVGPVVAASAEAATALAAAALAQARGMPVFVDAFDAGTNFTRWLHACGFEAQRPLYRMCRMPDGARPLPQAPTRLIEWSIFGPEFA